MNDKPTKSIKDGMDVRVRKLFYNSIKKLLKEINPPDKENWAYNISDDYGLTYVIMYYNEEYIVSAKMDSVDSNRKIIPGAEKVISFKFKNLEELI